LSARTGPPYSANICSMRTHRYQVAEYDPQRPWVLVDEIRQLTIQLNDDENFTAWAAQAWPPPRYKAELEPDELQPWRGAS
jgi:hypothetical protein